MGPMSPKQRASIHAAICRTNIWEGAIRSGKTVASWDPWLRHVIHGPEGPLAMAGKTQRTIEHNVINPLCETLGRRATYKSGKGELKICGRTIYVVGANDERAERRIRGATLAGAYVDELSIIPESFFRMLLTRLSIEGSKLFGTTNPDSPTHWLLDNYLGRAQVWITAEGEMLLSEAEDTLDLARFSFVLDDNETLSEAYKADLKRENAGLWYKRFILGQWVAAEGAIYDMLEAEPGGRHVVRKLPPLRNLRLAIDVGTANPFVALLMGVSAEPRLYVAREWRWDSKAKRRQLTDAEYVEHLKDWISGGCDGFKLDPQTRKGMPVPIEDVICDPSALSFRVAWQSRMGRWPKLADNAVVDGIRDTASLLAMDRLVFHESCKEAIAEHVGYVWNPKAQERGDDEPLKQADHAPDACRYGVRSYRSTWRRWSSLPTLTSKEAS